MRIANGYRVSVVVTCQPSKKNLLTMIDAANTCLLANESRYLKLVCFGITLTLPLILMCIDGNSLTHNPQSSRIFFTFQTLTGALLLFHLLVFLIEGRFSDQWFERKFSAMIDYFIRIFTKVIDRIAINDLWAEIRQNNNSNFCTLYNIPQKYEIKANLFKSKHIIHHHDRLYSKPIIR